MLGFTSLPPLPDPGPTAPFLLRLAECVIRAKARESEKAGFKSEC